MMSIFNFFCSSCCLLANLDCAAMLFCDLIENGNISAFTMIVNRMIAIP